MNCAQRDRQAYQLAMKFLLNKKDKGITDDVLKRYMKPERRSHPNSMAGIFLNMIGSAQNANMASGVIGRSIGGVKKLKPILFNFNTNKVASAYPDWQSLFHEIRERLNPHGKMREGKNSIWPRYCRAVLSSAAFLNQFTSTSDFYKLCGRLYKDKRSRAALPMILDKEIDGYGFALACDFLKELGYTDYGKPDVHIRDIFEALNLCGNNTSDYALLKSLIRVAENAGVTPYCADKMFWLIGSGYFYLHKETIGEDGKIGRMKAEFIVFAKEQLS